jgi:hypothetical protein
MKLYRSIIFVFAVCIAPVVSAQTDTVQPDPKFNFVVIDQPANTETDTAQSSTETQDAQKTIPLGVVILGWVAAFGLIGLGSYKLIQKQKKR